MSIEDDVTLLERVPTLRVLGSEALRVLAIGAESRSLGQSDFLFRAGDPADGAYVVRHGEFRMTAEDQPSSIVSAGAGQILGELGLILDAPRRVSAQARTGADVVRIPRGLFQRVLESYPDAAVRLRDLFAARSSQLTSEVVAVGDRLNSGF